MGKTIRDTYKSILNQSYTNFEIVIQDNDSKDEIEKIVRSFKDPRIAYYKNSVNIGAEKFKLSLTVSVGKNIWRPK